MKEKKPVNGFDQLSIAMDALSTALRPNRKNPTSQGTASNAIKDLSSSFQKNLRGKRKCSHPDPPVVSQSQRMTSPVTVIATRGNNDRVSSTRMTRASASMLPNSPSIAPTRLNFESNANTRSNLNEGAIQISSHMRGTKRLTNTAIMHLRAHEYFMVVVPPVNPSEPAKSRAMRTKALIDFSKAFLLEENTSTNQEPKDECIKNELNRHMFRRGEKQCHNFNVKLEHYAERDNLRTLLTRRVIEQYMSTHGRGLVVSLVGHSLRLTA